MIRSRPTSSLIAASLTAATLVFACGGSSSNQGPTESFVGTVSGTDAVVGLVVNGDDAFLFFCGGPTTLQSLTHWIHGTVQAGEPFQFTDGVVTASGSIAGGRASGTLRLSSGGSPEAWSAEAPASGTTAGVYAKNIPDEGLADLVVLPASGGEEPTAEGAFRTTASAIFQVTPLHPLENTSQGVAVNVTFAGSVHEEFLTPATAD